MRHIQVLPLPPQVGKIYTSPGAGRRACADGTYTDARAGACAQHGGLFQNAAARGRKRLQASRARRPEPVLPAPAPLPRPMLLLPPGPQPAASVPLPLEGIENDIPLRLAIDANRGTSLSPGKRGEAIVRDYIQYMTSLYNRGKALRQGEEEIAAFDDMFLRFRAGYADRYRSQLATSSRIMSTMLTGGSNFPVRQQNKIRETYDRKMRDMIEYEEKMKNALLTAPDRITIRSGESDTITRLREKLAQLEKKQMLMVSFNKIIRSKKNVFARLIEIGLTEKQAKEAEASGNMFEDFDLKNNSAEIRRIKQRIEAEGMREKALLSIAESYNFDGGTVDFNQAANRVQISFDSIPDADTRNMLKSRGFKWAPSAGAWQRQLTTNAISEVRRMFPAISGVHRIGCPGHGPGQPCGCGGRVAGPQIQPNRPVRSTRPDKKMMVLVRTRRGQQALIHFGDPRYRHNYSPEARADYLTRSAGIRDASGRRTKDNPLSANYWARRVLWASGEPYFGI